MDAWLWSSLFAMLDPRCPSASSLPACRNRYRSDRSRNKDCNIASKEGPGTSSLDLRSVSACVGLKQPAETDEVNARNCVTSALSMHPQRVWH